MRPTAALKATLLSTCLAGCGELPGEVVGTYRITMTLEDNTCGPHAVYRLDTKKYSAQLRSEDGRGYWRVPGQTPLLGKYEAPEFRFEFRSLVARSDADAGPMGCRLVQSEVLEGRVTLAAENQDEKPAAEETADIEGEHALTISGEPGSDCTSALAPAGAFEKLPCVVRYSLQGERIKSF
jgi:hypothetical protein